MDTSRKFRELQEADWESIGKELLAYALWWAGRYHWRSGSSKILPKGYELKDVVQHVIIQTISGERNWDPDKGELLPWLKDQVKSVIDALAKSASHRRETLIYGVNEGASLSDHDEYKALQIDLSDNLDRITPEEALIEKETKEEHEANILKNYYALFYAVEGDKELEEVIGAVIDGCGLKPRYLAQKLDVSVKDINNRLRRFRRKANSIKAERNE